MNRCFMAAWFALRNTLQIESLANIRMALWNCKKKKSNAKLIRVATRPSDIYTFRQQKFAFLQLSNFSNLRSELKPNALFV